MTLPAAPITVAPPRAQCFTRLVRDVTACRACDGMAYAHALSAANGPLDARVLFIAEAPGRRGAAITGVPLTLDESGRRFARFLALAGVGRDQCFVTNAVLCNPLDARGRNRTPSAAERARCLPHLARTLDVVAAPLVVTMGRVALEATRAIAPHAAELPRDAVRAVAWRGRMLVALYHPGRQSTLHRPEGAQDGDWRGLGEMVRRGEPSPPTPLPQGERGVRQRGTRAASVQAQPRAAALHARPASDAGAGRQRCLQFPANDSNTSLLSAVQSVK